MLRKLAPVLTLLMASCAPSLGMPPHLVASWPVDGASLSVARHMFELTFDRPLKPETSTAVVWREMDGAPLSTSAVVDSSESRRLRVRLLEPAAGAYQLRWHAVDAQSGASSDGAQSFNLQNESPAPAR